MYFLFPGESVVENNVPCALLNYMLLDCLAACAYLIQWISDHRVQGKSLYNIGTAEHSLYSGIFLRVTKINTENAITN